MEVLKSLFTEFWPVMVFILVLLYGVGKASGKIEDKLKRYDEEYKSLQEGVNTRLNILETKISNLDAAQASTSATLNAMLTQITSISSRVDTIISHLWNREK